jgi:carboxymethylenebutenolidase
MADEKPDLNANAETPDDPSRREFVAMSIAAGLAAATGSAAAADLPVVETDVEIKMAEGVCDAAFIHPTTGSHPGVLIWPDAFGLRPSMRDIARRLAAEGYSVLVPNPFYRLAKAPVIADPGSFSFQNPADMAKLQPLMASATAPGNAEKDAAVYVAYLDAQPSFHGGGLVTAAPTSPHLLAPKIKARMYFGVAANDDARQPEAKDKLREAFAAAKVPAEVEVYPEAQHGWCVPDMPKQPNGQPIYSKPDAEKAWTKLVALYKAGLA